MTQRQTDFLVIGSGLAGLHFALRAADHGRVLLITKANLIDSSSDWAQGGIAAVLDEADSLESHISDTLLAGDGLCDEPVVRETISRGPALISELVSLGVNFDRVASDPQQRFDLAQEGGHSRRRIAHAADLTGHELIRVLTSRVQAHPNITIMEQTIAIGLILNERAARGTSQAVCCGAFALDRTHATIVSISAMATILATGGVGKVYLYTTNPDVATGDGIAMAYRAGAMIENLEFIQFHPTCLYHPYAKSFLISEAVRGEGGVLVRRDGTSFMERHHPMKSLAPRDIVARAIDFEMKRHGDDCVYLDITHRDPAFIKSRFPHIYSRVLEFGIDMTRDPIPVVPAAHYACGGVATDLQGRTTLRGLLAVGECASTGLHGANRLASNSLLEAAIFSEAAVRAASEWRDRQTVAVPAVPIWDASRTTDSDDMVVVSHNWDEVRRCMWNYVGVVRSDKRLTRALRRISIIQQEIAEFYSHYRVNSDLIELRNVATVAKLIAESARSRKESRGLHFTLDYPDRNDIRWQKPTQLTCSRHDEQPIFLPPLQPRRSAFDWTRSTPMNSLALG